MKRCQKISEASALAPGEVFVGCDFDYAELAGADAGGARFIGCLLSGAKLRNLRLDGARFLSCYGFRAVDFSGSSLTGARVERSQFAALNAGSLGAERGWPSEVATLALDLKSKLARSRNDLCRELVSRRAYDAAPILTFLLGDAEWEVRTNALEALAQLRGEEFPDCDAEILESMFCLLGDEHSGPIAAAASLLKKLSPEDQVLSAVLARIDLPSPAEQLLGLRAAKTLHRIGLRTRLIDAAALQRRSTSESPAVRALAEDLLESK